MDFFSRLYDLIKDEKYVYIQTHNFPDHDAVASAYALQRLLETRGLPSRLVYEGEIVRSSLQRMIRSLNIDIRHISRYDMGTTQKVIIVDGCKWNNNVTDLIGDEVAVIDHHKVSAPEDVGLCDIRPLYGACSTIIFSYYRELGEPVPGDVATALMVGIVMDTMHFTRSVNQADLDAYVRLYPLADYELANTIVRNDVTYSDLQFYRYAIDNLMISERFGFVYFPEGCVGNLLGILGDFLLALDEVDFVVLCARNGDFINFSVRSEIPAWDASVIIREVLKNIGFGGGHIDMAGGVIKDISLFDSIKIYNKFKNNLQKKRK
ncbi:MAG: recombinase RecJ [bacterium]|nr:recombinase RecJ [bacterium]